MASKSVLIKVGNQQQKEQFRSQAKHERIENRRQNYLYSVYIDKLNSDIRNCKSDVDKEAARVALRRTKLKDAQKDWGQFLKSEVHNLQEFDQVMNKFDLDLARKGATIIEKETALKMGNLSMEFMLRDLTTNEKSKEFILQVAKIQQMSPDQILSQSPLKVIEFLQEFESWQIRKLENIEEQDTLMQRLSKDVQQEEKRQKKTIESLKEKMQIMQTRFKKQHEQTGARKRVCSFFERDMNEDDKIVSKKLTDIYNKLRQVESKTEVAISKFEGHNQNSHVDSELKLSEQTSIDLLKEVEKRTFYMLDLIDCLPQDLVDDKLCEILRRKQILESRQSHAEAERIRLEKLEKLRERANIPIPRHYGKQPKPKSMLKKQVGIDELRMQRKLEMEKMFFNEDSLDSNQEYFDGEK